MPWRKEERLFFKKDPKEKECERASNLDDPNRSHKVGAVCTTGKGSWTSSHEPSRVPQQRLGHPSAVTRGSICQQKKNTCHLGTAKNVEAEEERKIRRRLTKGTVGPFPSIMALANVVFDTGALPGTGVPEGADGLLVASRSHPGVETVAGGKLVARAMRRTVIQCRAIVRSPTWKDLLSLLMFEVSFMAHALKRGRRYSVCSSGWQSQTFL